MIQQTVVIKSNKYGITLCLDKDIAFRDLLSQIAEKFKASAKFFGDAQMALSFEGRRLSESEQLEVVQTIQENTSLEILCIMEQDTLTEAYMKEVLEDRKKELSASDGKFYKGTLRSGQVLEAGSSIIILGDVNPGAQVVSKGNIVILGCCMGNIYAGAAGDSTCFAAALTMKPMQLRIADRIARSGITKRTNTGEYPVEPMIVFIKNDHLQFKPITSEALCEYLV